MHFLQNILRLYPDFQVFERYRDRLNANGQKAELF